MRFLPLLFLLALHLEHVGGVSMSIDSSLDNSVLSLSGSVPTLTINSGPNVDVEIDWSGNEPNICKFPPVGTDSYFSETEDQNGVVLVGEFPGIAELISCGLTKQTVSNGGNHELSLSEYNVFSNLLNIKRTDANGNVYSIVRNIQIGFPKIIVASHSVTIEGAYLEQSTISSISYTHGSRLWEVELTLITRSPYQLVQKVYSPVAIPSDPKQRSINFLQMSEPSSPDQYGSVTQKIIFTVSDCDAWKLSNFEILTLTEKCRADAPSTCSDEYTVPTAVKISVTTVDACPVSSSYDVGEITLGFFRWMNEQRKESATLFGTSENIFIQASFTLPTEVSAVVTVTKICAVATKNAECGNGQVPFRTSNSGNDRITLPSNFDGKAAAVVFAQDFKKQIPNSNTVWVRMEMTISYSNTLTGNTNKRGITAKVGLGRLEFEGGSQDVVEDIVYDDLDSSSSANFGVPLLILAASIACSLMF